MFFFILVCTYQLYIYFSIFYLNIFLNKNVTILYVTLHKKIIFKKFFIKCLRLKLRKLCHWFNNNNNNKGCMCVVWIITKFIIYLFFSQYICLYNIYNMCYCFVYNISCIYRFGGYSSFLFFFSGLIIIIIIVSKHIIIIKQKYFWSISFFFCIYCWLLLL